MGLNLFDEHRQQRIVWVDHQRAPSTLQEGGCEFPPVGDVRFESEIAQAQAHDLEFRGGAHPLERGEWINKKSEEA